MRLVLIGVAGLLTLIWVLAPLVVGTGPAEPMAPGPPGDGSWLPPAADAATSEVSASVTESVPPSGSSKGTARPDGEATTTPAGGTGSAMAAEHHGLSAARHVHSEEEPPDQPVWSAIPADTQSEVLESLALAVEARLVAELTGEGREAYPEVVWRDAPCCLWVDVTGLVADFTISEAVRVIVEWETDQGRGSGPTYWSLDAIGSWVAAIPDVST